MLEDAEVTISRAVETLKSNPRFVDMRIESEYGRYIVEVKRLDGYVKRFYCTWKQLSDAENVHALVALMVGKIDDWLKEGV